MGYVEESLFSKDFEAHELGQKKKEQMLPDPTEAQLDALVTELPQDIARLEKWMLHLQKENPKLWKKMLKHDPFLGEHIKIASEVTKEFKKQPGKAREFYKKYVPIAQSINASLQYGAKEDGLQAQHKNQQMNSLGLGELKVKGEVMSYDEKKELKRFVKAAWKELFPPSSVEQYYLAWSRQKNLTVTQKIALAPVTGVEYAFFALQDLFQLHTYTEAYEGMHMILRMNGEDYRDLFEGMRIAMEQLDTEDMAGPAISILVSLCMFFGGTTRLMKLAGSFKHASLFQKILKTTQVVSSTVKGASLLDLTLPIPVVGGTTKSIKKKILG